MEMVFEGGAVEILALIASILIIVKFMFLIGGPSSWGGLVNWIAKKSSVWQAVYFILAVIVGYFLMTELTIVQIVATLLFANLLMGIAFMSYSNSLRTLAKEAEKKTPWFAILIYMLLAFYTLYILFLS